MPDETSSQGDSWAWYQPHPVAKPRPYNMAPVCLKCAVYVQLRIVAKNTELGVKVGMYPGPAFYLHDIMQVTSILQTSMFHLQNKDANDYFTGLL